MGLAWVLWLVLFLLSIGLVLLAVVVLTTLTDLEADHINPVTCCQRLNMLVVPEFGIYMLVVVFLLLSGNLLELLLLFPLALYHAKQAWEQSWRYDPTQIFRVKDERKKLYFGKLIFFSLVLFLFLLRFIYALVNGASLSFITAFSRPVVNLVRTILRIGK